MATQKKGQVVLRGGFPVGTRVGLYEAIGDSFTASLPKVGASQRVDKHSEATFDGLEIDKPYFVAAEVDGEWRSRRVVGKDPALTTTPMKRPKLIGPAGREQVVHNVSEERLEHAASLRSQQENPEIISGARASNSTRVRGHAKPTGPLALEHDTTTDRGRQDGLVPLGSKDEPKQLASDTFAGVAVEAAPDRLQQADVPKGVPQASSTELGDAAIIVESEEPPLGDIDPNRASGDSAVGPAGTISPAVLDSKGVAPKSTSKVERQAEKSARRKRSGAKRRPSKRTQAARVKRAKERAAAKTLEKSPGDLTPGTNPLAGEPQPQVETKRPPRKRSARPTRDARTPKRKGDDDAAKAAKRAAKNARERERRAAKKAAQKPPANA